MAAAGNQEEDILDRMEKESLCRTLRCCVDSLPEIQAEVIRSRYQGKLTLRERQATASVPSRGLLDL